MKSIYIFILLILCSCTNNKFSGYVYDYDAENPIKNVHVNINGILTQTDSMGCFNAETKSNTAVVILLQKEGYAFKKVYRKPDSLGMFSKKKLKKYKIYLFKKESDFSKK